MEDQQPNGAADRADDSLRAVLTELTSKGLGEYLRDSKLATRLAQEVAEELGIGRGWVTLAFELLAPLVESAGKAGGSWIAKTAAAQLKHKLRSLPFYDRLERILIHHLAKLQVGGRAEQELEDVLAGRLPSSEASFAETLSLDLQAHLKLLQNSEALSAQMADVINGIQALLNPQPPLTLRLRAQSEDARFVFGARAVDLLGRQAEIAALDGFLSDARRFCWWLIAGPGGQGKSRLALEFCMSRGVMWRTGFLPEKVEKQFDWRVWQPERPTLLVCDYAGNRPESLREIAVALFERDLSLEFPVRLLLLERDADAPWRQRFEACGNDGAAVRQSRHAEPLLLQGLCDNDLWGVITHFCCAARRRPPARVETLGCLVALDPDRRPLFAHFLADAVAAGRSPRGWDRAALLGDVLDREIAKHWKPAGVTEQDENLLALATMLGGVPVQTALSTGCSLLPDVAAFNPRRYATMTGQAAEKILAPLEPDILGEFFVLTHLDLRHIADDRLNRLSQLAWDISPHNKAHFLIRAVNDFPGEAALKPLCTAASRTIEQRENWSMAIAYIIGSFVKNSNSTFAKECWPTLKELANSYLNELPLRRWQAMGAFNLITAYCRESDLISARGLWDELYAYVTLAEPAVRTHLAEGAVNLIDAYGRESNFDEVISIWNRLDRLATSYSAEPILRQLQVGGAINVIRLYSDMPRVAIAAWKRLDNLVALYPDEPALCARLADGTFNLIIGLCKAHNFSAARKKWEYLDRISFTHPNKTALRKLQAITGVALIWGYSIMCRLATARRIWKKLYELAREHRDETELYNYVADAAIQLIGYAVQFGDDRFVQSIQEAVRHDALLAQRVRVLGEQIRFQQSS